MKVIMQVQTKWNGEVLRPGDIPDIETSTAERWIKKKIAVPVLLTSEDKSIQLRSPVIVKDLENKKYNELRKIATGKGIFVPRGIKKPELITLINQVDNPEETKESDEAGEGKKN